MQYRRFGQLDWEASALGFGAMRLPVIDDNPAQIDEPEAIDMIRYAIDQGVNYVDTAYVYHRQASEPLVGRALQDGYRERVKLATKLPCRLVTDAGDFDRFLNEQLRRLQTEPIDFYLLHGLRQRTWPLVRDLGVLAWAERALAAGKIRHLGFSFHDTYELFQEIVDATDLWTFCQIQYNFMDTEYQAGTEGLRYAAGQGLGVVVMEPLRGGRLTKKIPPSVQAIWNRDRLKRTPADLSLKWVWNRPEVSVVLSGMSTMEQVQQNLVSAQQSGPGTLTEEELALYGQVRDAYRELSPIPCTECQYCLPCPSGVNIPGIFEIYNDLIMYGDEERVRRLYWFIPEKERANLCAECGECLEECPQQIEIPAWLAKAHAALCS